MRRTSLTLTALTALIGAAGPAPAAVSVNVTFLGDPRTSALGTVLPDYGAFLVTLSTNDGSNITAVGFGDETPQSSENGFFAGSGGFLQVAAGQSTLTPSSTVRNGQTIFSLDTHLLPQDRVEIFSPKEDNNFVNPPGSPSDTRGSDFGAGTYLTGTFGIEAAAQASTLDLAYIVLRDGTTSFFKGDVATSNSGSVPFTVSGRIPPLVIGDLNGDFVADAVDIDRLRDAIARGIDDSLFDRNQDQMVNGRDFVFLVEEEINIDFGDTDTDGDVDLVDLGNLATGFGQGGGWARGNFDTDNDVDLADLGALATNFDAGGQAAYAAFEALVPEPSSQSLLALGGVLTTRRFRRGSVHPIR